MTVREAVSVLKEAKKIGLEWNGNTVDLIKGDAIMLDAYGSYRVDFINGFMPDSDTGVCTEYEIGIAVMPIREVTA